MAKVKEVFVCQSCGTPSAKWQGQCAGCGEWNTLVAEVRSGGPGAPGRTAGRSGRLDPPVSLAAEAADEQPRISSGSAELDRVLGGGLVAGSVTLIGGDPGIGKSTLMLQSAAALAAAGPVLYATGEESIKQVALRARRSGARRVDRPAGGRDPSRVHRGDRLEPQGARAHRRLHPDHVFPADRHGTRRRLAAARVHRGAGALRQDERDRGAARRPRDQGGTDCGSPGPRAHGRYGAVLRKRYGQPVSRIALGEESFRRRQRDRCIRDGGAGPARGHQPVGHFPVASPDTRVGKRDHGDARRYPLAPDRSAGAGRFEHGLESRDGLRSASTATA